jgi:hypothetical protein
MATNPGSTRAPSVVRGRIDQRLTTETKHSSKTTELYFMVAVIAGILISALVIDGGDNGGDQFIARQAWLYVAIVAGAYFVSRGLAKSGSREPYWSDGTNSERDGTR